MIVNLNSATGRGLIDVKAQLGLDLPNDTQAGLSLFHQLHCLVCEGSYIIGFK